VSALDFLRFLASWQHVDAERKLEGPLGVLEVVKQLAGFEVPAAAWEASVMPARVRDFKRHWLDELTLSGEVAWGRLWGSGSSTIRSTPVCLVPREELDAWLGLVQMPDISGLGFAAKSLHDLLRGKGAMFAQGLERASGMALDEVEEGLAELVARGLVSCDSFGGLRSLLWNANRRAAPKMAGRWSLFWHEAPRAPDAEFVARQLLRRTGVVFRRTVLREKQPLPWRDLLRVLRTIRSARSRQFTPLGAAARRDRAGLRFGGRSAELSRHPHARRTRIPALAQESLGRVVRRHGGLRVGTFSRMGLHIWEPKLLVRSQKKDFWSANR
jgi:ATP-dependent Lhr-like helicase